MKKIDVGCRSYMAQVAASAWPKVAVRAGQRVNGAGERQIVAEESLLCGT